MIKPSPEQIMLWVKTRNLGLMFITGVFFGALYLGSTIVQPASTGIIMLLLICELAGILYMIIWR